MMSPPPGAKVYLACKPVDMRKGFNGLSSEVMEVLRSDPYAGHLFVFRGKRGDMLKILYWDGTGLCLFSKRLEHGAFMWPSTATERVQMTAAQLALLIEGIDWRKTHLPHPRYGILDQRKNPVFA